MEDDKSGKPPPLMGATAIRPPERHGIDKYTYILYDPKNGTVLTRTPKSWALIIIFYCIYYSCLAAFWMACMKIFLHIQINEQEPTWKMADSIIGTNPGIGVRPSQIEENVGTGIFEIDTKFEWKGGNEDDIKTLINKTLEDLGRAKKWKDIRAAGGNVGYALRAHEFFKSYGKVDQKEVAGSCLDDKYRSERHKLCPFDLTSLGACQNFPYGYSNTSDQYGLAPCVFLKFNRIMGLEPTPIDKANAEKQDDSLKSDDSIEFLKDLKDQSYPKGVYIKCEGEYPADKEVLKDMKMFPAAPGIKNTAKIPLKYFPYDKKRIHNESPLVALQFKIDADGAKVHAGRLIHIMCKAYYDKVKHSKKDKAGLVKFELYYLPPIKKN